MLFSQYLTFKILLHPSFYYSHNRIVLAKCSLNRMEELDYNDFITALREDEFPMLSGRHWVVHYHATRGIVYIFTLLIHLLIPHPLPRGLPYNVVISAMLSM